MPKTELKIATRKSPLALWQAEEVAARVTKLFPEVKVTLVKLSTQGDRILDTPLAKVGGKGLFVKELEQGMLAGDADIAVHSMKDVPMAFPAGLHLAVVLDRAAEAVDADREVSAVPVVVIGETDLERPRLVALVVPDGDVDVGRA